MLRLVFQGSVPVPDIAIAEVFYNQLKDLLQHTSLSCTLNGQIIKMLEPCCGDPKKPNLSPRVYMVPPR